MVGFEEYSKHVNGLPSRLFLNIVQVPMDFSRSWASMLSEVGHRNVLIVGLVRSLLSVLFLSVHHMIPKDKLFGLHEANSYSGSI